LTAKPQIATEFAKNPNLMDGKAFMAKDPPLAAWLKEHPNVAQELKTNPTEYAN